jgi:hypothetical protein
MEGRYDERQRLRAVTNMHHSVHDPAGYPMENAAIAKAPKVKAAGVLAASVAGALTFGISKAAIDRVLLAKAPNKTKLFDRLTAMDTVRPKLTAKLLWTSMGPSATRLSVNAFANTQGLPLVSAFLALMWAVMVAPYAQVRHSMRSWLSGRVAIPRIQRLQCKGECAMMPLGEARAWGAERRLRESDEIAAIKATMPPGTQARTPRDTP